MVAISVFSGRVGLLKTNLMEISPMADEMIGFAAEKLMELEVGAKTGAAYGEKNARSGLRNVMATASETGRRVPGPSSCVSRSFAPAAIPELPEPRRMAEKALTAVIQDAYPTSGAFRPEPSMTLSSHGHERYLQEPGQPPM